MFILLNKLLKLEQIIVFQCGSSSSTALFYFTNIVLFDTEIDEKKTILNACLIKKSPSTSSFSVCPVLGCFTDSSPGQ